MTLFALGLNHQTAPLEIRERVAFAAHALENALGELIQGRAASEAAILSTCNRTEVYVSAAETERTTAWLAEYHRLRPGDLSPYLYTLPREQAVRHAFRVASGLDSMVLGEPQILGQLKEAVRVAESAGTLGTVLINMRTMHDAGIGYHCGKQGGLSMSAVGAPARHAGKFDVDRFFPVREGK